MPITYTNRKGVKYYLCLSTTKAGKPHYYFAREQKGEPVDELPPGYKIGETVNGQVYLQPDRTGPIRPEEVEIVEAAIRRHPQSRNYRVDLKRDWIVVYENTNPDEEELLSLAKQISILTANRREALSSLAEKWAHFEPVMRFTLVDAEQRTFRAERMTYSGHGGWRELWDEEAQPLVELADRLIPTLGTDEFFELC